MNHSNREQECAGPDVPDRFMCPLTLEPFSQPVKDVETGHTYSKAAIYQWMFSEKNRRSPTCPLTRRPLHPSRLVRNIQLENEVNHWKRQNNLPISEQEVEDEEDDDCYDVEVSTLMKSLQKTQQFRVQDEQTLAHLTCLREKVLLSRDRRFLQQQQ